MRGDPRNGGLVSQNLDAPGETRTFNDGGLAVITSGSACDKPVVGTDSCAAAHLGYIVSGRLHVEMDDGTAADAGPGDLFEIAPGHDAWIVGDEPCVVIDLERFARSDVSRGCR